MCGFEVVAVEFAVSFVRETELERCFLTQSVIAHD
jgi:hypothetical protein